ncbi:DUF7286 family protein [Halorubrum sp. HHNYT27]|uniref:DUF7286 family protein n=1 Tax=Halorubrum sp. HHNYT27 TaxID=3402275 RepID=UPI003EBCA4B9
MPGDDQRKSEKGLGSRSERAGRRFTVDERARVPFALIGVLLLVTSTTYAAGLADQGLVGEDRSVERAVERVDADATSALRTAAREATHAAAAEPVTRAPETGTGTEAVRDGSAFTDALRIRLAVAGADALSTVDTEVGMVTATASLPAVDDRTDLSAARDRVHVEPAANGTATRVTFEEVTTTATRSGRTVVNRTGNRTVVVAVPTLAAHERTEQFEERLGRGPVAGPGLGRQLTASLYPMAWARGYAQYGGAPVENVIANRHVELSTNAGIVRSQRAVFGTSDPAARGGVARATARTGVRDLLAPTGVHEASWTDAVLGTPTPGDSGEPARRSSAGTATRNEGSEDAAFEPKRDRTDEETPVRIGHAADVGATRVHDDLDEVIKGAYRVEADLETETAQVADGGRLSPPTPDAETDGEWKRVSVSRSERVAGVSGSDVPREVPSGVVEPGESVPFGDATREVAVERAATATWEREVVKRGPNGSVVDRTVHRTTTSDEATDRYRVRVSVRGRHAPRDDAPNRPAATFGSGSPDDVTDLRATPGAARTALGVGTANGVDRLAREAVRSGDIGDSTVVWGSPSNAERGRVATDVASLAATVREFETNASMEAAAVGEAEPYAELADALRDRREALVDAPATYDSATDRARIAARAAYVDAVIAELESAAAEREHATERVLDGVSDAFGGPAVGEVIAAREAAKDPGTYAVGTDGPGGAVTFSPRGSPGYLPRTTVEGERIEGVDVASTRPLAVRNVNYATVPYGEASSGIVDRLFGGGDVVRVSTAGRALLLADEALASGDDSALRADRNALADRVERSLRTVDRNLKNVLRARTSLTREERTDAISEVAASYGSAGERAAAVGDGEYAERVATEAAAAGGLSTAAEASLAAHLRVATRNAAGRDATRVPIRLVEPATKGARLLLRDRMESAIETKAAQTGETATRELGERAAKEFGDKWSLKPVRTVGAGLPVAPVPGYWVTTVNAWRVHVRGEYPRFVLHADVGTPAEPFEYVRQEGDVTIELDGETVRLGSTEPIRFETQTVVVVAVPAGPPGVGDVDGTRDETAPGWPCPGATAPPERTNWECAAA